MVLAFEDQGSSGKVAQIEHRRPPRERAHALDGVAKILESRERHFSAIVWCRLVRMRLARVPLVAAWFFPWREWRKHPLGPTLLYLALLAIPFILVASRRSDRFAPFYPLVAVICAWAAVYAWRAEVLLRTSVAAIPAVIIGLAVYFHFLGDQAKDLSGQHMVDFVHAVKARANDGRPILFCKTNNRGLAVQALLGVNQRGLYEHEAPDSGAWVIAEGPVRARPWIAFSVAKA